MSEHTLRSTVMSFLRRLPRAFVVKHHGGPHGVAGLPDVYVQQSTTRGLVVLWIELKMPGNKPTAIQRAVMDQLARSGTPVYVCHSLAEVRAALAKAGAVTGEPDEDR